MSRVRVLVVDDSPTQRAALISLLEADPDLTVVGWAADGAEAVRATARLKPDVITMDLRMPGMDGVEATRRIMQETPTPIVMVTATTAREDAVIAFNAMQAGVLTIVDKPVLSLGSIAETPAKSGSSAQDLPRTLKAMAQVKVIRRWSKERLASYQSTTPTQSPGAAPSQVTPPAHAAPSAVPLERTRRTPPTDAAPARPAGTPSTSSTSSMSSAGSTAEVVAIGASTGGPQVLATVLPALPADFRLPVLVVQHIASGFDAALVDWLRTLCTLPVQLARDGFPLDVPGIYVAPTGTHLVAQRRRMTLTHDVPVGGHRPSVTVLFQSVAREYRGAAVGVLLSGMGDDGAAGMRDLKRSGALTIAQDEASSVVFGMPAVAIAMGVADHVLPPPDIGRLLATLPAASSSRARA